MKTVVIVHGLGSSPSEMRRYGQYFERAGYKVEYVEYNSNLVGDEKEVQAELDRIYASNNVHGVVGHSQGGRVINSLAQDNYDFGGASLFAVNSPLVSNKSRKVKFLQTFQDPFRLIDPYSASANYSGNHDMQLSQMSTILNDLGRAQPSGQSNDISTRSQNLNRNSQYFSTFK